MILIDFSVNLTGEVLDFIASMTSSVLSWPVAFFVVVAMFYKPLKRLIGRVKNGKVLGVEFEIGDQIEEADEAASESFERAVERVLARVQDPTANPDNETEPSASVEESVPNPPVQNDVESTSTSPRATDDIVSEPTGNSSAEQLVRTFSVAWDTYRKMLLAKRSVEDADSDDYSLAGSEQDASDGVFTILRSYQRLETALRDLFMKVRPHSKGQSNAWLMATYLVSTGHLDENFLDSLDGLRRVRNKVAHGQAKPSAREAREFTKTVAKLLAVIRSQMDEASD